MVTAQLVTGARVGRSIIGVLFPLRTSGEVVLGFDVSFSWDDTLALVHKLIKVKHLKPRQTGELTKFFLSISYF